MPLFRLLFACLPFCSLAAHSAPLSSRFTYQGVLEQSGAPATGEFDLRFEPFGSAAGGAPLAPALTLDNVPVQDGLFRAELDFGPGFFVGDEVFLSIGVRAGTSTGSFTTLAPRQAVTATPYALTALELANTGTGQASLLGRTGFTERQISLNAESPSMIVGRDGYPIISFFDPVQGDLRVTHCEDVTCQAHTTVTVDSIGIVGEFSSIAIMRTGLPAISYYDRTNGDLKIAYCQTVSCSSSTVHTVDSAGNVGQYTSMVGGGSNTSPALIFYQDAGNGDLKVARCRGTGCNDSVLFTLDSSGDVGRYAHAAVGHPSNDASYVWVAYYAADTSSVKIAACFSSGCSTGGSIASAPAVVQTGVTQPNAIGIAIGSDNRAWIGYNSGSTARVARCNAPTSCSAPVITSFGGLNGSMAMSTSGDGIVWAGGRAADGRARLGRCTGHSDCSGAAAWTMSATSSSDTSPVSLASAANGAMMLAATYDGALRLFHCGSTRTCSPATWPR